VSCMQLVCRGKIVYNWKSSTPANSLDRFSIESYLCIHLAKRRTVAYPLVICMVNLCLPPEEKARTFLGRYMWKFAITCVYIYILIRSFFKLRKPWFSAVT
jgi:hypothetical protein